MSIISHCHRTQSFDRKLLQKSNDARMTEQTNKLFSVNQHQSHYVNFTSQANNTSTWIIHLALGWMKSCKSIVNDRDFASQLKVCSDWNWIAVIPLPKLVQLVVAIENSTDFWMSFDLFEAFEFIQNAEYLFIRIPCETISYLMCLMSHICYKMYSPHANIGWK